MKCVHEKEFPTEIDALYRYRPLVLFLLGRLSSTVAYQMLSVAVGWQIYALTGSPIYLGLVGLAQFLPMCLFSLLAGHVADGYDRRMIFRVCQITQAIGVLVLAIGSFESWLSKEHILLIAFLLGAARAFETPTAQALLPNLVSPEFFPRAVAWSASLLQAGSIAGPALGGFLYTAGSAVAYTVMGAIYLCGSLFVSLITIRNTPVEREPVSLKSLFAGIAFIRSKQAILGAISLDLFAVLLGGATALLPVYAREILFTGPWGLGFLRSAPAVGALIMSVFLARFPLRHHVGPIMFVAVVVFGLGTMAFAISTSFSFSLATLVFLGGADVISVVIRQSLVQAETPDFMRGRVSAVNSLFVGTSNQLGEFESGVTAAWFGTKTAVLIGGIGTIIVAVLWTRLFPALTRVDSLDGPAEHG